MDCIVAMETKISRSQSLTPDIPILSPLCSQVSGCVMIYY